MRILSRISDIMSSPVQVVGPKDTLAHARNLMLRGRISRLVAVDGEQKPIGVITRTDIAREASRQSLGAEDSLDRVLVEEAMTESPFNLKPNNTILDAAEAMLHRGISGVPIVDNDGSLSGILSKTDVVKYYIENETDGVRVNDVETHQVTTILSSTTLYKAEDLMRKKKIGRLVVLENEKPIGMITQRDLSFAKYSSKGPQNKFRRTRTMSDDVQMSKVRLAEEATVGEIMRSPPVTIRETDGVAVAARLMIDRGIGGVPVVDSRGNLTGIITKTDILRALIIREARSPTSRKLR